MSAIRSTRRSTARASISSPYARPAPKKSSWSITGLLSYFNPLRSRSASQESVQEEDPESDLEWHASEHGRSAAEALSTRGQQISNTLRSRNIVAEQPPAPANKQFAVPPPQPSASSASSSSPTRAPVTYKDLSVEPTTPREGLDIVTSFLDSHRGQAISSIEAEGLISLIKKSAPAEKHETFRFSSSPSTPLRGNSPVFPSTNSMPFQFSASSTSLNGTSSATPSPGKLLKHNPNGRYRWEGGGSARPARSRNRFHSPAFGPSRPSSDRLVLRESPEKASEPIRTDTKRRRVGTEASVSSAASSGPSPSTPPPRSGAPAPSPTRVAHFPFPISSPNGSFPASKSTPAASDSAPKINGLSSSASTSRLGPPKAHAKPTTPAIPSPLRQAWGQATTPSPSSKSDHDGSPPQRQTKAANYMSELIKEVTPVKKLDVLNPYQAASPVQITGSAKPRARRLRATGKPQLPKEVNGKSKEEKPAEKEKEYSAQAIIEATVPKGSKRSRAPANIGKLNGMANGSPSTISRSPSPPSLSSSSAPQIEEVEDEEEEKSRATKRSKPNGIESSTNGAVRTSPVKSAPTIEEVEDEEMSDKPMTTPSEVIEVGSKPLAAPLSNTTRTPFGGNLRGSAIPKEPSKLRFSYKPETASPSPAPAATPSASLPTPDSSKESSFSSSATLDAQPKASSSTTTQKISPKEAALAVPWTSLPSFSFTLPTSGSGLSTKALDKARSFARDVPRELLPQFSFSTASGAGESSAGPSSRPAQSFNYSAAGLKAPGISSSGAWTCFTCMLVNEDAAADKCCICDTPRVGKAPAAPVQSFNYSAAGMKAPGGSGSGGSWTCSTCMLENKEASAEKCTICDTPRAPKPTAPATQGFNYAAAGLKPPEQKSGMWSCSTCGLKNDDSAPKCQICDAPR